MLEETLVISRSEYQQLLDQNKQLFSTLQAATANNQELMGRITMLLQEMKNMQRMLFGSKSEKRRYISEGQITMDLGDAFNEPEACAGDNAPETEPSTVSAKSKAKKHRSLMDKLPKDMRVEVIHRTLADADLHCPHCSERMEELDEDIIRRLKVVPAQFYVEETHVHKYVCRNCQNNGTEPPIHVAPDAAQTIPGGIATPSVIAWLMAQKFVMFSPLYRIEQDLNRSGIELSRQTMSNWLLFASGRWLKPIYDALHRMLLKEDILHADETTFQVLHEPGKTAQSDSWIWLYRTGNTAPMQIVLYEYHARRSADNPKEFLKGFSGCLQTDGYSTYNTLPENILHAGCWAHARRYFEKVIKTAGSDLPDFSLAKKAMAWIDRLFELEKPLKELTPTEREKRRNEEMQPVLDELHEWLMQPHYFSKDAPIGKAMTYLRNQFDHLRTFLGDGRIEMTNNLAERSIKPFVMGRKNFLFANVPKGAAASATIYSLINTAIENQLDPFRYLSWVLETAPQLAVDIHPELAEKLIPMNAPDFCKAGVSA